MCACICICEERERERERERESVRTVRQYIMICVNECMRARMRACMYVLKCVLHNVGRWGGENQSDPNWEIGFGFGSCRARGRRGAARAPSLVRAVYCQKGRPPSTPGGQFPDRDRAMCRIAGGAIPGSRSRDRRDSERGVIPRSRPRDRPNCRGGGDSRIAVARSARLKGGAIPGSRSRDRPDSGGGLPRSRSRDRPDSGGK